MPTVADTVSRYIELLAAGSAEELAALYTPDATVEDPVGSGSRRGRDAIRQLYSRFENLDRTADSCRCTSSPTRRHSWRA